jgi:hypothetical protein
VIADVGLQRPEGFLRHRRRHQGDEVVGGEAERVLQNIQGNLSCLTQRIPMVQVEDLPEAMQRQVVGVARAWVRLFRHLENVVFFYHDTHPAPQA